MTTHLTATPRAEIITFKVGDEDWRELRLASRAEAPADQPPAPDAEAELTLAEQAIGSCDPFDPLGRLAAPGIRPTEEVGFALCTATPPLEESPTRSPLGVMAAAVPCLEPREEEAWALTGLEAELDLMVFPWEASDAAGSHITGLSVATQRMVEAALDRLALSLEAAESAVAASLPIQPPSAPPPPRVRFRHALLPLASTAAALLALLGGLGMTRAGSPRPRPATPMAVPVRTLPQSVGAYQVRAEAGDPVAMRLLAFCYQEGLEVPKDPRLAHHWRDRAAQATVQDRRP